jgi:hypothetical protein
LAWAVAAGLLWAIPDAQTLGMIVAILAGVGAGVGLLRWFRALDGQTYAYYLMNDYAHSAAGLGAYGTPLEDRLAEFSRTVADALAGSADEVLVVGHSTGAHLAVSVVADVLRKRSPVKDGPKLAVLTLGQVTPMVSFLPRAERLRADLRYLCVSEDVAWVDVSAPGDGCCFALCDPVAVSGVAPADQRWPLVFSAAFTQSLSLERWRALRWRFFRLHFQYICAFDRPKDFDYFQITAGPMTLAARYDGRAQSRSRITKPLNTFRTCSR